MKKLFIVILILFILVGIIGFISWVRNPFSKDILKLEIIASREADLFDRIEYQVRYRNNGNVRLDEAVLVFEFPNLTIPDQEFSLRNEVELDSIYPGEERIITFTGRIIGKEREIKKASASLRYRPRNITAFYESSTSFSTIIRSIPISFELELSSKVAAERPFSFSIDYFSRLEYPLSDLKIMLEYPSGFNFLESKPRGIEEGEWEIPLLNKTEGGRIEIKGEVQGKVSEQKIFKASLGIWKEGSFVILKEVIKGTEISDPDLYIFQRINNQDEYIAKPGELLHYEIYFRNIGQEPFSRLSLITRLKGDFFDLDSVKIFDGRQSNSDLMWDWREVSKLEYLDKGEEGLVEFWVEVKDEENLPNKGSLVNLVSISQMTEEFFVKVNTKAEFAQKVFYNDDVFGNRGPIPPQAGQVTTYTVSWQAKNFNNDLEDVAIKTILPYNVKLTGDFFPKEKENQITFDSQSREIIWRIGNLKASSIPVNVSFQVALTPSINQVGQVLPIIQETTMTGIDSWTKSEIKIISSRVDTNLPHDSISSGQGIVQ
ncbi:MAG: hypothetical protein PHN37_00715 [Candidatus Pacebacteria bacterium]|nr:hypothetical protein [Candidatus Paceibacterota bacterium]